MIIRCFVLGIIGWQAEDLIERVLFLESPTDLTLRASLNIGKDVPKMIISE